MLIPTANRKPDMAGLFFPILFIYILCAFVAAEEHSAGRIIATAFNATDNTIKKCELLFSLKKLIPETDRQTPVWIGELLGSALNDKSPVVVADAVYLIGEFNLAEYTPNLIALYNELRIKFGTSGYSERVQCAIITALGKNGTIEAKTFLSRLLQSDKGSFRGEYILSAIEQIDDPVFVKDVIDYKTRMETFVANAKRQGCNPFLYSVKSAYIKRAGDVGTSLLKGRE